MPMSAFYMNFSNDHIEIILMVKLHNYFASFASIIGKNVCHMLKCISGFRKAGTDEEACDNSDFHTASRLQA